MRRSRFCFALAGISITFLCVSSGAAQNTPAGVRVSIIPALVSGPGWNEDYRYALGGASGTLQVAFPNRWNVELHGEVLGAFDLVPIFTCLITFPITQECEDIRDPDPKFITLAVKRRVTAEASGAALGIGVGYGGVYERHVIPFASAEWQFGRRWGPRLEIHVLPVPGEPGVIMPGSIGFRVPLAN